MTETIIHIVQAPIKTIVIRSQRIMIHGATTFTITTGDMAVEAVAEIDIERQAKMFEILLKNDCNLIKNKVILIPRCKLHFSDTVYISCKYKFTGKKGN